jgi:hypothetical protein
VSTDQQRSARSEEFTAGLAGPVATIRACVAALVALAGMLGVLADDAGAALAAYGVSGLVPIALGVVVRGFNKSSVIAAHRCENAAILMAAVALCWNPWFCSPRSGSRSSRPALWR